MIQSTKLHFFSLIFMTRFTGTLWLLSATLEQQKVQHAGQLTRVYISFVSLGQHKAAEVHNYFPTSPLPSVLQMSFDSCISFHSLHRHTKCPLLSSPDIPLHTPTPISALTHILVCHHPTLLSRTRSFWMRSFWIEVFRIVDHFCHYFLITENLSTSRDCGLDSKRNLGTVMLSMATPNF